MSRKRIFSRVMMAVLVLVAAGIVLLFTLDLGFLKGTVEERVRQATGRDFIIEDGFSVRMGRELLIEAEGIRLGNPEWSAGEHLLTLERAAAVIRPMSLFGGPVVIRRLDLGGLDLQLEQDAEGRANWQFGEEEPGPGDMEGLPFLVESLSVTRSTAGLSSPRLDRAISARVDSLEQDVEAGGSLRTAWSGALGDRPVDFEFSAGPYEHLLQGKDVELQGNGRFGEIAVSGHARMDDLWSPRLPEFELRVSGPDVQELSHMLGIDGLAGGALSLTASGTRIDAGLNLDIEGQAGELEIRALSQMATLQDTAGAVFEAQASGPDFGRIARLAGYEGWPRQPFDIKTRLQRPDGGLQIEHFILSLAGASIGLLGEVPAFPELAGARLNLQVSGQDISRFQGVAGIEGLPAGPFHLKGDVSAGPDGATGVDLVFETPVADGELRGNLGGEALVGADLQVSARGENMAGLQPFAGPGLGLPAQPFEVTGRIRGLAAAWGLSELTAETGGVLLRVNGKLGRNDSLDGTDLSVEAEGADLGARFELTGPARLPDGPFRVATRLGIDGRRLSLDGMEFRAGTFNLALDARLPWPVDLAEGSFDLRSSGDDISQVLTELAGVTLAAQDFEVAAKGSWGGGRVSVESGDARIGDATIRAGGTLDLPPDLSATDLVFEWATPDLSRLGTVDGSALGAVPAGLRSSFTGTKGQFLMKQFQAQLGDSRVEGDFAMDFEPKTPKFSLSLSTDSLDLRPLLGGGQDDGGEGATGDGRLIPDLAFPMDALASTDGRFELSAGLVRLESATLRNNTIRGELRDGRLEISEIGTDGYRGRLVAAADLAPLDGSARLSATARSQGLIVNLSGRPEEEKAALPAFDIDVSLAGAGKGLREAAASLNGGMRLTSMGGQVRNLKSESAAALFLSEVISAISPSEGRRDVIDISCIAADIEVENGMVRLEPGIGLQSDKLNIYAGGKINLDSESIDVNFRTETRKAADVAASELFSPYVKLSGTLSDPKVALDPKGTLLSGATTYLSGGLSILAKKAIGQVTGSGDPCADILKQSGDTP